MTDEAMKDEWKDHLNKSLDEAHKESEPWAEGVRENIFEHRKAAYKEQQGRWKTHGNAVIKASRLAGRIARVCADFEPGQGQKAEVTTEHMLAGIAAAHIICKARVTDENLAPRLFWCE